MNNFLKTAISAISFWGAIIGALLLALNVPISGWGYVFFLLANIASVYIMRRDNGPRVITWQIYAFTLINVVGFIRWIL
jgi:hypothetical protein